ncbi:uncharacterized protein LOC106053062 isoform X2 [Biomphalaria glabrata]|nr:uncharacterized protein LOC106053062 isoform X2 [Biomphalaria glabrata]
MAKRGQECTELKECISIISGFDPTNIMSVFSLTDQDNYDQFCQQQDAVQVCVEHYKGDCEDTTAVDVANSFVDTLEFLCSDEGNDVLTTLSNSPCASEEDVQNSALNDLQVCFETFQTEFQVQALKEISEGRFLENINMCPFLSTLKTCVNGALTTTCGDGLSPVMDRLWELNQASTPELAGNC